MIILHYLPNCVCGVNDKAMSWFSSYLTKRVSSCGWWPIVLKDQDYIGNPTGIDNGSLLFIIYMNDLPLSLATYTLMTQHNMSLDVLLQRLRLKWIARYVSSFSEVKINSIVLSEKKTKTMMTVSSRKLIESRSVTGHMPPFRMPPGHLYSTRTRCSPNAVRRAGFRTFSFIILTP